MKPAMEVDQTLYKSLLVLEAVARSSNSCGVTDLADRLGLTKSNTHRILRGLVTMGYLRSSEERGRYELTSKLWEIGSFFFSKLDIRKVCAPYMTKVAEATQETVLLSVLDGTEVLFLAMIESSQAIRAYTAVGQRAPAHCVATGLVQLAESGNTAVDQMKTALSQHTPRTITTLELLYARLEQVRRDGFSISECEWVSNANAVAVPLRDATGRVIAGLGVTGPADRLDGPACHRHAPFLLKVGREISELLGYSDN